jgi:cell division protease FtsH
VSSGASSDISYATDLAKNMVTQWGMSDKLGPLKYGDNQEEVFLGHSVTRTQNVSEETARLIDAEVKAIVTHGYDRAKQLLTDNIDQLHALAAALLEVETLTGDEIRRVIAGERVERGGDRIALPAPGSTGVSAIPKSGRRGGFGDPAPAPQA